MKNFKKMKSTFATQKQLDEIQKAIATTDTASEIIPFEIDPQVVKREYSKAPTITYLEGNGIFKDTKNWKGKYKLKNRNTSSEFINQTDKLPEHDPSDFSREEWEQSIIVYPIEIGDFVQESETDFDLMKDEINDGILDVKRTLNKTVVNGDGTGKDFSGIVNQIQTNTIDAANNNLTEVMLDEASLKIEENDGAITAIVTSPEVRTYLKNLLYPKYRVVDKVELPIGIRVVAYSSPTGEDVPIIADREMSAGGVHKLAMLDENVLEGRTLMETAPVDLAKTRLSDSKILVKSSTFYNKAEWQNALISGIKV